MNYPEKGSAPNQGLRACFREQQNSVAFWPKSQALPRTVADVLNSPPQSGQGFHSWLFRAALMCQGRRTEAEIFALLQSAAHTCGRIVPEREIFDAIKSSARVHAENQRSNHHDLRTARSRIPHSKWPSCDDQKLAAVLENGRTLVDLWEASQVRFDDNCSHTEEIIDALFPDNPLLCCGFAANKFDTRSREEWRGQLGNLSLVVPSPMLTRTGITQDGKKSAHTLSNTGARRFLVLEFDQGTVDDHTRVLWHLAETTAPLALAVHSGNKSLHGWFYAEDRDEEDLRRFMRYAVTLGADRATWTRTQFVRMPDGLRSNGARQTVFFFRPEVIR